MNWSFQLYSARDFPPWDGILDMVSDGGYTGVEGFDGVYSDPSAGISSYNSQRTQEAAAILKELGTPCLIHQPSYSMINRWVEDDGLLDTLEGLGIDSSRSRTASGR